MTAFDLNKPPSNQPSANPPTLPFLPSYRRPVLSSLDSLPAGGVNQERERAQAIVKKLNAKNRRRKEDAQEEVYIYIFTK